jgi:hypothetical protein
MELSLRTVAASTPRELSAAVFARPRYIAGRGYDWAFFLLPPLLALGAGVAISGSAFSHRAVTAGGVETTGASLLIGTIIHAHLVAVFFRSHGNPSIFRQHPVRFIAVPVVLWSAIMGSTWVAITASVIATFWDVWHSGAQTFGLARIYDAKAGAPPEQGRRLDFWLNQLFYAGPILAGATLMDHVDAFDEYATVGATFFTTIPAQVDDGRRFLTWAVIGGGSLFVAYYLFAYWRMSRRGYRVSPLKVWLLASTGACSIYTWGFNTWGEAFFIMNLFHAVQYLALVWVMEHKKLGERIPVRNSPARTLFVAIAFFGAVFGYGCAVQLVDPDIEAFWAITIVISLMHFWYDAFIWSVRKAQV